MVEVRTHVEPASLIHDDAHRMDVLHPIPDLLLSCYQGQRLEVRSVGKADVRTHGRRIQSDGTIFDDGDGQRSTSLNPAIRKNGHAPPLQPRQAGYGVPSPCPARDGNAPVKRG